MFVDLIFSWVEFIMRDSRSSWELLMPLQKRPFKGVFSKLFWINGWLRKEISATYILHTFCVSFFSLHQVGNGALVYILQIIWWSFLNARMWLFVIVALINIIGDEARMFSNQFLTASNNVVTTMHLEPWSMCLELQDRLQHVDLVEATWWGGMLQCKLFEKYINGKERKIF